MLPLHRLITIESLSICEQYLKPLPRTFFNCAGSDPGSSSKTYDSRSLYRIER